MSALATLLVLLAVPAGPVEYASGVQVRPEPPPAAYVQYPTPEELGKVDSPLLQSWRERLAVGDAAVWRVSFQAASAAFASGGAEGLRTTWHPLVPAVELCARLAAAPEKLRPVLGQQHCRLLDDGLAALPTDDAAFSAQWLEPRVHREELLARLGAPAIAAVLIKAAQARQLPYGLRSEGQAARSATWWSATRLAVEQAASVEQKLVLAALVPRRLPESAKWLEAFCAKTPRTDAERRACSAKPPAGPTFQGEGTFLKSDEVLADAKFLAGQGTSEAELLQAAEACVRNEARERGLEGTSGVGFSSTAREACLSLLAELDFGRASRLIKDDSLWFVTSAPHFELVAAVVMGKPPVEALQSVGLLPAGFKPPRFTSHYPRDLLRTAGNAASVGVERGEVARALSLGRTPLAGAILEYVPKSRAATLWFKGHRYSATLPPGPAGAGVAAFLNEVARREKLEARWLCLGEGYFSELVVGTEAQLAAALSRKLLLREASLPSE